MKNFLLILIVIFGSGYYFIPYETKVELLEKVGIDSSILPAEEINELEKGEVVNLKFDETTHKTSFKGNITSGKIMTDLSWASLPYVKCFYSANYNNFNGNTVIHRVLLLKNKNVVVKLIPDNENSNLSMYVYKTDALSKIFPPEINYVFDCKNDISLNNEVLIDMKGNTAPSDIVIGVAGTNGTLEGGYTLEIEEK